MIDLKLGCVGNAVLMRRLLDSSHFTLIKCIAKLTFQSTSSNRSESIIGAWLAKRGPALRQRLVLATKTRFSTDASDPNAVGLSRKNILQRYEG